MVYLCIYGYPHSKRKQFFLRFIKLKNSRGTAPLFSKSQKTVRTSIEGVVISTRIARADVIEGWPTMLRWLTKTLCCSDSFCCQLSCSFNLLFSSLVWFALFDSFLTTFVIETPQEVVSVNCGCLFLSPSSLPYLHPTLFTPTQLWSYPPFSPS